MNLKSRLDRILSSALILILALMVLNVLWQVFSRYILQTPSSFTDELSRYLMIWIGILGAAYVSGMNAHVRIDVFVSRLSKGMQKKIQLMVRLAIAFFSLVVLIIGGSRLVYISFILGQKSPALQIPLAYVYLVLPLSGCIIIIYKSLEHFNQKLN
ncbi:MAG: TRAP transporter small permease [Flavobacteriaceae bacterium]